MVFIISKNDPDLWADLTDLCSRHLCLRFPSTCGNLQVTLKTRKGKRNPTAREISIPKSRNEITKRTNAQDILGGVTCCLSALMQ